MTLNSSDSGQAIEIALARLQAERSSCVARLTALLERDDAGREVEGFLAQIETINATLIRLASSYQDA